jgi:hypothetical protein
MGVSCVARVVRPTEKLAFQTNRTSLVLAKFVNSLSESGIGYKKTHGSA